MNVVVGRKGFISVPLEVRFWARVEKSENCWRWTGTNSRGYGRIWSQGRRWATHRLAWEMANGPVPAGLDVCHHCDNPSCVNPKHLFLGTAHDNAVDAENKGRLRHEGNALRTTCRHGHEFTRENTYVEPKTGYRGCRECRSAAHIKRRAALSGHEGYRARHREHNRRWRAKLKAGAIHEEQP